MFTDEELDGLEQTAKECYPKDVVIIQIIDQAKKANKLHKKLLNMIEQRDAYLEESHSWIQRSIINGQCAIKWQTKFEIAMDALNKIGCDCSCLEDYTNKHNVLEKLRKLNENKN